MILASLSQSPNTYPSHIFSPSPLPADVPVSGLPRTCKQFLSTWRPPKFYMAFKALAMKTMQRKSGVALLEETSPKASAPRCKFSTHSPQTILWDLRLIPLPTLLYLYFPSHLLFSSPSPFLPFLPFLSLTQYTSPSTPPPQNHQPRYDTVPGGHTRPDDPKTTTAKATTTASSQAKTTTAEATTTTRNDPKPTPPPPSTPRSTPRSTLIYFIIIFL